MSKPAGFVPIQFHMAGRILLGLGIIVFVLFGVSQLTGWFILPPVSMAVCIAVFLGSLYLIFAVHRDEEVYHRSYSIKIER